MSFIGMFAFKHSSQQNLWQLQDVNFVLMSQPRHSLALMIVCKPRPVLQSGQGMTHLAHCLHNRATYHNVVLQRAICEAYGIVINVITSDQQHWFMRYEPEVQPKKSVEVFVTYIAPIHYNAVR